ncbi:unnamed protein product [Fasciola hepatica]|uniref:Uncharacterized protein n=1 Tax=Fasciola hepatica TaxID=6192 RepID=A0ABC9HGT5_FASHE
MSQVCNGFLVHIGLLTDWPPNKVTVFRKEPHVNGFGSGYCATVTSSPRMVTLILLVHQNNERFHVYLCDPSSDKNHKFSSTTNALSNRGTMDIDVNVNNNPMNHDMFGIELREPEVPGHVSKPKITSDQPNQFS